MGATQKPQQVSSDLFASRLKELLQLAALPTVLRSLGGKVQAILSFPPVSTPNPAPISQCMDVCNTDWHLLGSIGHHKVVSGTCTKNVSLEHMP